MKLARTELLTCLRPHRDTNLKGSIHVRFADGSDESVGDGDDCYWPPGHMTWAEEDYEAIEVSPSIAMGQAINLLTSKLNC